MIRVDSVWMATAPLDMRVGPDTVLMHAGGALALRILTTLMSLRIGAAIV